MIILTIFSFFELQSINQKSTFDKSDASNSARKSKPKTKVQGVAQLKTGTVFRTSVSLVFSALWLINFWYRRDSKNPITRLRFYVIRNQLWLSDVSIEFF